MNSIDIAVDPEIVLDGLDIDDIIDYLGVDNVLAEISASDAAAYYGHDNLLEEIGDDKAIQYFEIEVAE